MEPQKTLIGQRNLEKENKAGDITLPDLNFYYKPIVIKIVWFWHKNRIDTDGTESRAWK